MNLSYLSDDNLIRETKKAVAQEREALTLVLHHLREIERRRLFSTLKCESLFEYATAHLGYSSDAAVRRISAMRLMRSLPEIENKIQDGKISLTNLNLAQTLFRREAKSDRCDESDPTNKGDFRNKTTGFSNEQKLQILERLENKSSREAVKIIQSYSSLPAPVVEEKMRVVANDVIEIKFAISEDVQKKVLILKGLVAHADPNMSLARLFEKLCDLGIENWDPGKRQVRKRKAETATQKKSPAAQQELSGTNLESPKVDAKQVGVPAIMIHEKCSSEKDAQSLGMSRSLQKGISAHITRDVWKRAQSQCENCKSTYALQIDHRQPRELGGTDDFSNLRLLCRACNQRAAIEALSLEQMERFI